MGIIITKNGKKAVSVEKSKIEKEEFLQQYVHDNPECIPLHEVNEDKKLLILAREFMTNSGPIDALGVDADGDIYIIETKLYANSDKRRVIAQALDYGAALWKHANAFSEFTAAVDEYTKAHFSQRMAERIEEYFSLSDEQVQDVLASMENNLDEGVIRYVVLMDVIDDRLKDLVLYVNQNSKFDIYAVSLEYYEHGDQEIIIPQLFGAEVKKDVAKSQSKKQRWDWERFRDERLVEYGDSAVQAVQSILNQYERYGMYITWGDSIRGSFALCFAVSPTKGFYPFTVSGDGIVGWNAPHQGDKAPAPFNQVSYREEIIRRLSEIPDATADISNVNGYSGLKIPLPALAESKNLEIFFATCTWIREELDKIHVK